MSELRDFQQRTADYVFKRLYEDGADSTTRFLVADEVGLGKTMVARDVLQRAVKRLEGEVNRIDVLYICSNQLIAQQNLNRLVPNRKPTRIPNRITMLPIHTDLLKTQEAGEDGVNYIAFTPGTSFNIARGGGLFEERKLIRTLLGMRVWSGKSMKDGYRVFQGSVARRRYSALRDDFEIYAATYGPKVDKSIRSRFKQELSQTKTTGTDRLLRREFDQLAQIFHPTSNVTDRASLTRRNVFIGQLRSCLVRACLQALEPDLIIMDEFQRFRNLILPEGHPDETEATQLARELLNYKDKGGSQARVLLLSATPYKMHTNPGEGEDHFADFVDTFDFLADNASRATGESQELAGSDAAELVRSLTDLRLGISKLAIDESGILKARQSIEQMLRKVMVRTERIASSNDGLGMVQTHIVPLALTKGDALQYQRLTELTDSVSVGDPIEFWKSAPFVPNFCDGVKLGEALRENTDGIRSKAAKLPATDALDFDSVHRFEDIADQGAAFRWLRDDLFRNDAELLLWVPASLPYFRPAGAFANQTEVTKRLVFSSWRMVPTTLSSLLSYEAERRVAQKSGERYGYLANRESEGDEGRRRSNIGDLLTASTDNQSTMALVYASSALADLGDPRRSKAAAEFTDIQQHLAETADRIGSALESLLDEHDFVRTTTGIADQRWYYLAGPLLDCRENVRRGEDHWNQHRQEDAKFATTVLDAWRAIESRNRAGQLGRLPEDLLGILAKIATFGPANAALRALRRSSGQSTVTEDQLDGAAVIGDEFRSLFNGPEATQIVRSTVPQSSPPTPYWQQVMHYCADGNLEAVLEEFLHMLQGSIGISANSDDAAARLASAAAERISLRTVSYDAHDLSGGDYRARKDARGLCSSIGGRGVSRQQQRQSNRGRDHRLQLPVLAIRRDNDFRWTGGVGLSYILPRHRSLESAIEPRGSGAAGWTGAPFQGPRREEEPRSQLRQFRGWGGRLLGSDVSSGRGAEPNGVGHVPILGATRPKQDRPLHAGNTVIA